MTLVGPFWSQGHNLNKLGKGLLDNAKPKCQGARPLWFQTRIFIFPIIFISLYKKNVTPGQGHFWPQGHNLNTLSKGPLDGATYLISMLQALNGPYSIISDKFGQI